MDRWWKARGVLAHEARLLELSPCSLYDGETKTRFTHGDLLLTSQNLYWRGDGQLLALSVAVIQLMEEVSESSMFLARHYLVTYVAARPPSQAVGPVPHSDAHSVRLKLHDGAAVTRLRLAIEGIQKQAAVARPASAVGQPRALKTGIASIEASLTARSRQQGAHISAAFEDMSQLGKRAKEMVGICKQMAEKVKSQQGDELTADETAQFRSYLLSMGIANPVTKESSGSQYHTELAKEVDRTLAPVVKKVGGALTLADAFCYMNRARGMALLSPEDLQQACRLLNGDLHLVSQRGGLLLLQTRELESAATAEATASRVREAGELTSERFARLLGVSVTAARDRLLAAETAGLLCRDDSCEGLKFYENRFMVEA